MVAQQQNYIFYLNLSTAAIKQISGELSKFAQDYMRSILIPNLGQGGIIHGLGAIEGEEGLLGVIKGSSMPEYHVMPVLRYNPKVYRLNQDTLPQILEEGVYASRLDPFIADWSYYLFGLEPDLTNEGIRKMLQNALAMQKFLQRVSGN